jgi:hypothetical protein
MYPIREKRPKIRTIEESGPVFRYPIRPADPNANVRNDINVAINTNISFMLISDPPLLRNLFIKI